MQSPTHVKHSSQMSASLLFFIFFPLRSIASSAQSGLAMDRDSKLLFKKGDAIAHPC
jgi:hypothetical protein